MYMHIPHCGKLVKFDGKEVHMNLRFLKPTLSKDCIVLSSQSLSLNRVEIEEVVDIRSSSGAVRPRPKTKSYDLNHSDSFWQQHKGRSVSWGEQTVGSVPQVVIATGNLQDR